MRFDKAAVFLVAVVLLPACRKKPQSLLEQCSRTNAAPCATLCDRQPGPICNLAADYDPANSVKYLTKGCEAKDPEGCQRLVAAYSTGENAPRDMEKARQYADATCSLGDSVFCKQAKKLVTSKE